MGQRAEGPRWDQRLSGCVCNLKGIRGGGFQRGEVERPEEARRVGTDTFNGDAGGAQSRRFEKRFEERRLEEDPVVAGGGEQVPDGLLGVRQSRGSGGEKLTPGHSGPIICWTAVPARFHRLEQ